MGVCCRRSQYFTFLSHDPVIRSGCEELVGLGIISQHRMGASWAATWTGVVALAPRSSKRAALSAPTPTTFVPSYSR